MNPRWTGGGVTWIVQRAADWAPADLCHRLEEEWLADLSTYTDPVLRLRFALGCCWAAVSVRGATLAPGSTAAEREALAVPGDILPVTPGSVGPSRRRSPVINAGAALIALFISALPLVYTHRYMPGLIFGAREGSLIDTLGTVYASDPRTLRRVGVEDGTRVVMNRGARIVVLYSEYLRAVLLEQGEATFTVAREASRPFDLTVGGRRLSTLAATFDVRVTGRDSMEITVLKGNLTVLPSHARAPGHSDAQGEGDMSYLAPMLLKAAQAIDIEPGKESARTLSELEAQARVAWNRG